MKEINLTQGFKAIVDNEDYDRINQFPWQVRPAYNKNGHVTYYAIRSQYVPYRKYIHHAMAREILYLTKGDGIIIDHHDGNPLNNQKSNLRICTHKQNCYNKKNVKNKNGIKGVCFLDDGRRRPWRGMLRTSGRRYTQDFATKEEAALYYNAMAQEHFGEFAALNKI